MAEVSAALREAGAEVTEVGDLRKLDAVVAGFSPGTLDCHLQLPVQLAARGSTVTERVRNFLQDGLLARFSAAATMLQAVSDEGRVVLVGGNTPIEASAPDDHGARLALLDVLAHAIHAGRGVGEEEAGRTWGGGWGGLPGGRGPNRIAGRGGEMSWGGGGGGGGGGKGHF